jgi:hypothetical protein
MAVEAVGASTYQNRLARGLVRLALGPQEERIPLLRKIRRYWFSEWLVSDVGGWDAYGEEIDCSFSSLVHNYLPTQQERDELAGWLLFTRLRPFPSLEACRAAARHTAALEEATDRRNAALNKLHRKPPPSSQQ